MNCPKCGEPLQISKKDPSFGLCYNCKKKFRLPNTSAEKVSVDDIPVKQTNKAIMDETKVMKAIRDIDKATAPSSTSIPEPETVPEPARDKVPEKHAAPKKRPAPEKRQPSDRRPAPEKKKVPVKRHPQKPAQSGYYTDDQYDDVPHHQKKKYANIPPSKVRSSREDEMRSGYDELLSIENEKQGIGSKIFTVIVLLIILALIGGGVFYLYQKVIRGTSSSSIDAAVTEKVAATADTDDVVYEDEEITVLS